MTSLYFSPAGGNPPIYLFSGPALDEECRLHLLDVHQPLLFYLTRLVPVWKAPNLFGAYADPKQGKTISSQRLSCWIVEAIKLSCLLVKRLLPGPVQVHSTRAIATSTVFLRGTLLHDVCYVAKWVFPHIFMRHYALDEQLHVRLRLERDVLLTST